MSALVPPLLLLGVKLKLIVLLLLLLPPVVLLLVPSLPEIPLPALRSATALQIPPTRACAEEASGATRNSAAWCAHAAEPEASTSVAIAGPTAPSEPSEPLGDPKSALCEALRLRGGMRVSVKGAAAPGTIIRRRPAMG